MPATSAGERQPLLAETSDPEETKGHKWSPSTISILLLAVVAAANLADGMASTPLNRTYESIVCYRYWAEHDPSKLLLPWDRVGPGADGGVAEHFCKIAPVQAEVALVKGWQIFFDGIPGLLLGVPIGAAADYFGRRPVIIVGVLALTLRVFWMEVVCFFWQSLPLRLVWLSSLHGLVSGGAPVVSAICLCLISDITTASNRITHLLRVAAASMIMNYSGPAVAAVIMKASSTWTALAAALAIWVLSFLLALCLPETLNYSHPSLEHPPLRPEIHQDPPVATAPEHIVSTAPHSIAGTLHRMRSAIADNTSFLFSDARICLMIFPYIGLMLNEAVREMLVLYASVRFEVSIADATFYTLGGAFSKTLTLLLILPLGASMLTRYISGLPPLYRDLILTRVSLLLLALGWVLTGLALSLLLFAFAVLVAALGAGANSLCRSFLTEIVGRQNSGKLYTIISVVECLSVMLGGPIISYLYRAALDVGGILIGLPFYFIGAVYALAAVATMLVRPVKGDPGYEIEDEESVQGDEALAQADAHQDARNRR